MKGIELELDGLKTVEAPTWLDSRLSFSLRYLQQLAGRFGTGEVARWFVDPPPPKCQTLTRSMLMQPNEEPTSSCSRLTAPSS